MEIVNIINMQIHIAEVIKDDLGIRLDRWFRRYYPNLPYIILLKLIRKGQVRVDGKRVKGSDKLKLGQKIRFPMPDILPEKEKKIPYIEANFSKLKADFESNIIFEDENIIAINKPEAIAVQGGTNIKFSIDTLAEKIYKDAVFNIRLVHRLDKDTSGILVLAKGSSIAAKIAELFKHRKITKTYLSILNNVPKTKSGEIETGIIKGKEDKGYEYMKVTDCSIKKSTTKYRVLSQYNDQLSLVQMHPLTGRTHQLRVHSAQIGCPILGDKKYGSKISNALKLNSKKLFLHAYCLRFNLEGKLYDLKADLPKHFLMICEKYNLKLT